MSWLMTGKVRVLGCFGGETGGGERNKHADKYMSSVVTEEKMRIQRRKG